MSVSWTVGKTYKFGDYHPSFHDITVWRSISAEGLYQPYSEWNNDGQQDKCGSSLAPRVRNAVVHVKNVSISVGLQGPRGTQLCQRVHDSVLRQQRHPRLPAGHLSSNCARRPGHGGDVGNVHARQAVNTVVCDRVQPEPDQRWST
jgi:hypothetical protein